MKLKRRRNPAIALILLGFFLAGTGCGYRVRSSVGSLPAGIRSLGIPVFQNTTNEYKVEQLLTGAVLKEFNLRTRVRISPQKTGVDALLLGEITAVNSTPVAFDSRSFGSAYIVRVQMSARMIRLEDSKILWQDKGFTFQERYTLNGNVRDFFSEENPALSRLAEALASNLVSTIMESRSLDSSKP
jgi:hypothetical protein